MSLQLKTRRNILIIAAVVNFFLVMLFELYISGQEEIFVGSGPHFGTFYFIRTTLIFTTGWLAVLAARLCGLVSSGPLDGSVDDEINFSFQEKLFITGALLCQSVFLILALTLPDSFEWLGLENRPVETVSAFLSLLGAGFLFASGWMLKKTRQWKCCCTAFLMAFILFVLGMEEISWTQSILNFETPEVFSGNDQNEVNLHNFATDVLEVYYYFGACLALVFIPFVARKAGFNKRHQWGNYFIPSFVVALVSCVAMTYNHDMWDDLTMQLGFFITLFILIYYAVLASGRKNNMFVIISLFVFIVSQMIFLFFGGQMEELTEYREFFIALGLFSYAWEVFLRTKKEF